MGVIVSRAKKWSRKIDKQLRKDHEIELTVVKLLLLGPSDCGKSTVLKQMRILHNIKFTESEIQLQKCIIYVNIVSSMKTILEAMKVCEIHFDNLEREVNAAVIEEVYNNLREDANFTLIPSTVTSVKKLWGDAGVQKCFKRGSEYHLNDSAKYFFDNIDRISDPTFTPNEQDILRSRIPTTGIVEITFVSKEFTIRMFDVGGQRSERRKWIHCFDNVDAVLYIASLSEYNMLLSEDGTTNRMNESLQLFQQLCNSAYFAKAAMILFLNKTDLFEERLKIYSLTVAFPEYSGSQTYEDCITYVESKFLNTKTTKGIYVHRTCATDTKCVEKVFNFCVDVIISQNLKESGIISR